MGKLFEISVMQETVIIPSQSTPKSSLALSTIDSQAPYTIEYLLVYDHNLSSPRDRKAFTTRLKKGLSQALVEYYPFAGRVEEGLEGLQVVFEGQSEGVIFIEVEWDDFTRTDFEKGPLNEEAAWRPFLSHEVDDVVLAVAGESPLIIVQLTWLADGAVALAFGFNHYICDGTGGAQFLSHLAKLIHGIDNVSEPQPLWQRYLLDPQPCEPMPNISEYPYFHHIEDKCGFEDRYLSETLVPTSIDFSKRQIDELKTQAKAKLETEPQPSFTSFEVISAHLWRSWAKALKMPQNQVTKILFPINFRNISELGLPVGFYGNAVVSLCAQTTVGDLIDRGLGYGSNLIRKAKERVDCKYVREMIKLLSQNPDSTHFVGVFSITSWTRLGLDKIDFGLGEPTYVGTILCDELCHLLPIPNQKDAIRVTHAVPRDAVDLYRSLLTDEPF